MLTRFFVNNFRNLLNIEFRPVGVNLLIGPNNAGKTNLCNALRFLACSGSGPLDDIAAWVLLENWNITNAYSPGNQITFEADLDTEKDGVKYSFTYKLQLTADRESITGKQSLNVAKETLTVTGGGHSELALIENTQGNARIWCGSASVKNGEGSEPGDAFESQVPTQATALSKVFDGKRNPLALWFKQCLGTFHYFNLIPQALRSPKVSGKMSKVGTDGESFNKFLFDLHNQRPRLERKLIDCIKLIEPKIDVFKFFSPDPEFIHVLYDDKNGHSFSLNTMSDGTLRYLALCGLIAMLDEPIVPPPIVVFEEPENGIYVGHLKSLFGLLDFANPRGQCIFTSHSPYVIDLFDAYPESIHLMKPGVPACSLTKPDVQKVRRLLNDMPLGEMHYRELLG